MHKVKRSTYHTQQQLASTGKLTVLALALSGALAAMTVTHAQTISSALTTQQSWTSGDLTISSSGSVSVSAGSAIAASGSSLGALTNSGLISGSTYAIDYTGSGTNSSLTNNSGGTISGDTVGIYNVSGSTIGTLSNSGIISSNNKGINNGGTIISLTNNSGGTISGAYGIYNSGTITSLSNSGLITGTSYAIYNTANGTISSFTNSGTIAGTIRNLSSRDLSINGGTGSTFGTLTGLSSGIGTITNTASNVVFASGNQLLNDNINVGTHTVSNLAGTLQVNNHLTITGNYSQASAATLQIGVANGATSNGLDSDTGYGRLYVSGTSAIASGSTVSLTKLNNSYAFATGQRYVVIETTGAATYNASALNYSVSGYAVTGASVADSTNTGATDLVLTL